MQKTHDILLSSTLHDPRSVFLDVIQQACEVVSQNYKGWVINVTTTTDQGVKDLLRELAPLGIYMTETSKNIVENKVENDHLYLLAQTARIANLLRVQRIQYTDGDRIITAAVHFPEDLREIARSADELTTDKKSYLGFIRTPEDYLSHHAALLFTELHANRLYSEAFAMPLDIGSTAHAMSVDVLQEIIRRSPQMEPVSFPHPKWLIIAKQMEAKIKSVEVKGLPFETPDQFKREVEELTHENFGGVDYEQLQDAYMRTLGAKSNINPREWHLRFNTQEEYTRLLAHHLGSLGLEPEQEAVMNAKIEKSIESLDDTRQTLMEAFENLTQVEGIQASGDKERL